jgi:hypothetical protein
MARERFQDIKGRWYTAEVLHIVKEIVGFNEEEAARRIYEKAKKRCPVGEWERDIYKSGTAEGKGWTARKPGSLRDSIRIRKSDYPDGGYAIIAGSWDVFWASFVELGVPAHHIPKDPFLRGPLAQEKRKFRAKLKGSLPT